MPQFPGLQLAANLSQKNSYTYLGFGPLRYDPTGITLASSVLLWNAVDLALLRSWEDQVLEKMYLA